ncbi:hypothetical protein SGCZBJ_09110 [Caulobacter zeae]|uniref:Uncharacterized protein n=2 Tax=Caulobacter zeae TaxID=2055137 RepID=A0A2N5DKA1_9CAUL|nr:hypothetical protein SGCZBJ_09110 [Caulobacter zeae]
MNTIQQLVGAAGIAIAFSVTTATKTALVAGGESIRPAMARGAQHSYLVAFGMVVVGLLAALMMPRKSPLNGMPIAAH